MVSSISGSMAASWASSLFSKLDTTNQGYIDKGGLQSAFSQAAATDSTTASTDVDAIFTQLDADGDGKITETEFSDTLTTLMDQLYSKDGSMCGGMGMPPSPPGGMGAAADEGFTQDELTSMAQEIGTSDSKGSGLMASLAANFDAADTDGNGRVDRAEAMAFDQASQTDSTPASTTTATADTDTGLDGKAAALMKLIELIQSYASSDKDSDESATSGLSITA
jgi:hypothetical protein